MFVKFEDKNYMIKFSHTPFTKPNKRRSTVCTVYELRPNGVSDKLINFDGNQVPAIELFTAEAMTSKVDAAMFSKAVGRTLSYQRVLRKMITQGYFQDGNQAWKHFMTELNKQHPNGMEEAKKVLADPYYTNPQAWF